MYCTGMEEVGPVILPQPHRKVPSDTNISLEQVVCHDRHRISNIRKTGCLACSSFYKVYILIHTICSVKYVLYSMNEIRLSITNNY